MAAEPQIPASIKERAQALKPTPYDWRQHENILVCKSCQCSRSFMLIIDEGRARAVQCSVCLKAYLLREES
jgi:hypothetical protein